MQDLRAILQKILTLPEQLVEIRKSLTRMNENLEVAVFGKEEQHFVAVYIECFAKETLTRSKSEFDDGDYGREVAEPVRRGSLGYSAMITKQHTFRIQPSQTIKGLRIVVFCDLSKVVVKTMQCANRDVMVANDGSGACPIGYFDGTLTPANVLYIVVETR